MKRYVILEWWAARCRYVADGRTPGTAERCLAFVRRVEQALPYRMPVKPLLRLIDYSGTPPISHLGHYTDDELAGWERWGEATR
ncbi:hypothetical protein LCGC14_2414620 [marine sediment metagenome]|uniref:Uncharacterized protein n=1 Tax=marine sediment metagenome TaxID=412755 RepID=A0A0F9CDN6_9ZZZZ